MNYQKPTEHIEEEDVKRSDFVKIVHPYIFTTHCLF